MRRVAIIGTGQTKHTKARDDVSQAELVREAVTRALDDAGITFRDVDAVVLSNMELFEGRALPEMWVGEGAGGYCKPLMKIATGGTSGTSACIAGYHQCASGLFDVVLVVGWEKHSEGATQTGMALTAPLWDRNVASGAVLNQGDAMEAEVDWAAENAAIVSDPAQWVGQVAARMLLPGQALRQSMVKPPQAFAAGTQVRVVAQGPGFQVTADGQALGAGVVGQLVRVRMENGRIMNGTVLDRNTVQVEI